MAEFENLSSQPSTQPQQSPHSLTGNPVSSSVSAARHRIATDGISANFRTQTDDTSGPLWPYSLSPEPQRRPPAGAVESNSPPITTSWVNLSEDGDLGSRSLTTSLDLICGVSVERNQDPQGSLSQPVSSSRGPRPKPAPIQFQDISVGYFSPARSSRPNFSPRGRFHHSRTNSRSNLLHTPSTTAWRSPRTPPPYSATIPRTNKWWFWRPAWFMYLSFFFGVLCAIGHHIFYKTLDGRPADDQLAMLRYGTVLAFVAKASLVAAVITAFKQRIWTTVRSKFLSVAAVDSLFAATEDLSALVNIEIYKRAKVAMLLAAFIWLTPLVIILTSNTLTVEPAVRVDNTTCRGIRTLNFAQEGLEEWRNPTKIDGLNGLSVSLWNTTSQNTSSPDWLDYYTGPSNPLARVTAQAAYMGQAVGKTGANIDICGSGWNCTYTVNFAAPAYKCSEVASGIGSEIKPLGGQKPPNGLSTKLLLPEGDFSYYAYTGGGDYSPMQMNATMDGGVPMAAPPFPETLGCFRTEPVLWIGYSVRTKMDGEPPISRSMPGWNDAFIPKVIACEHYETDYTVLFNLTGGQQITNVTERKFVRRVIDTTWIQGEDANDGTNDNTTAVPNSNYIYPRDLHRYKRLAAFHSIGAQLRGFLNGTINSQKTTNPIVNTRVDQTKLLDLRHDYFAFPELVGLVPEFYENMVFSLFSNQQFVSVVWATNPAVTAGTVPGDESTAYPCVRTRFENRYYYHERDLWIVYSIAILLAAVGVVSGTLAVLENEGVLRNTRFSTIVAATRGLAFEKLGWVGGDDRGDLPRDVKSVKVGYGIVHRGSGLGVLQSDTGYLERAAGDVGDVRYGFGLEGDVRQLKRESSFLR